MVDRSDMVSPSGSCTARSNWTSENGLAGDAANNMVPDGRGGIVVQCYPDGLQRIDIVTGEVSGFVVRAGDMDVSPDYLIRDKEGNLWASGHSWIIRVDAATGKQDAIFCDERLNGTVMAMDDSRDRLWIASSRGVYMLSKETLGIRRAEVAGRNYSAIYYDGTAGMVYAASTDGVLLFSPQIVAGTENPRPLHTP